MKELISIIVPLYNVESYIEKCINSIINQTYKNLEIILVDDGSKDESGKICDKYSKEDKRIKVIHRVNGGVSDARNAGINVASGEYIAFVDSDDYVSSDYIEYMYTIMKNNNSDMAFCGMQVINKYKIISKYKEEKKEILSTKETLEKLLYADGIKLPAVCAVLYPRSFFEDIKFPVGKIYEDIAVIAKLINKAKRITLGYKRCYFYATRKGSISKRGIFDKAELDYIKNTNEMLDYIRNNIEGLDDAILRYRLYSKFRSLRILLFSEIKNDEIQKQLVKDIKSLSKSVYKNKKAPKRDKVAIILLGLGINVFKISWYLYSKFTGRII